MSVQTRSSPGLRVPGGASAYGGTQVMGHSAPVGAEDLACLAGNVQEGSQTAGALGAHAHIPAGMCLPPRGARRTSPSSSPSPGTWSAAGEEQTQARGRWWWGTIWLGDPCRMDGAWGGRGGLREPPGQCALAVEDCPGGRPDPSCRRGLCLASVGPGERGWLEGDPSRQRLWIC